MLDQLPPMAAYIDGAWEGRGAFFRCENPATGTSLCELPATSDDGIDRAVGAAQAAFDGEWRSWSPGRRQHTLARLAQLVEANGDELARLESAESGVPIAIARRFSVAAMAKNLAYFASWIDKLGGQVVPLTTATAFDYVVPEPYGVVAVLAAYNTPRCSSAQRSGPHWRRATPSS